MADTLTTNLWIFFLVPPSPWESLESLRVPETSAVQPHSYRIPRAKERGAWVAE